MKLAAFLLLMVLVFGGVSAYVLHQKGLLKRETVGLFLERKPVEEKPPPEPIGLAASVRAKELKLKEEAEQVRQMQERIEIQRQELDAQRTLIEKKLQELAPVSAEGQPLPAEEFEKLVKMYEAMPPEEAAPILDNLPDTTVAQILLEMRGRQASQILAELNTDKAARISRLLAPEEATMALP